MLTCFFSINFICKQEEYIFYEKIAQIISVGIKNNPNNEKIFISSLKNKKTNGMI